MAPQEAVRPLVSWCRALGPCEFGCLVVTGKRAGSVTIVGLGSISVIGSGSISVIGTSEARGRVLYLLSVRVLCLLSERVKTRVVGD